MVYNPHPPYELLQNRLIDFPTMQKLRRFARYWDLVGNSGNFVETTPLIWRVMGQASRLSSEQSAGTSQAEQLDRPRAGWRKRQAGRLPYYLPSLPSCAGANGCTGGWAGRMALRSSA